MRKQTASALAVVAVAGPVSAAMAAEQQQAERRLAIESLAPGSVTDERRLARRAALRARVADERRAERRAARRRAARKARRERRAAASAPKVAVPAHLQAIAACESGGNPSAIGGGGLYRGKYQFDRATWASVGGQGDPAAAPEAEQDRRAALLYARAGAAPWPVCGR